jgi:ELWxxDGT repeat protein
MRRVDILRGLILLAALAGLSTTLAPAHAGGRRLFISHETLGSFPECLSNVNGTLYFSARDGIHGEELWKSDGTAPGTKMVKDIARGQMADANSYPCSFTDASGTLFFTAFDPTHGWALRKTDGTPEGTVLVKHRGRQIYAEELTNVNGTLSFVSITRAHGDELWKTDGTDAGTVLVKDINPGPNGSSPYLLTSLNGRLYFAANDGVNGWELWRSDGTGAGTDLVKDIGMPQVFPWDDIGSLTDVDGTLYFPASGAGGTELWRSDGTEAGTVLVKDISVSRGSNPVPFAGVNGELFFGASTWTSGRELWTSDGTASGTVLVKDINPGRASSLFGFPVALGVGGTLFFSANDGTHGQELWESDGTAAGTILVRDIHPGPRPLPPRSGYVGPYSLTEMSGTLYFAADDGVHGTELWKSDGTREGTAMVRDIHPGPVGSGPGFLTDVNGTLIFSASDGVHGQELWKSDGTKAGTVMVKDIDQRSSRG